jgi:hypothetical protein
MWRENGSAIYSSGPCQSSHSGVQVPQNSRSYFTVTFETPPAWRARSPYLYPPGTGWPSYTPFPFRRLILLAGLRWKYCNPPPRGSFLNSEVKLRPTVNRPVRLGVRLPSRTRDQFFSLLAIFFRQLRVCYYVAPSLTRGRVCNLLLLVVLASAVPQDSNPYIIVPLLENPSTWRARSQYLYPTRNRVAQMYHRSLGSHSSK